MTKTRIDPYVMARTRVAYVEILGFIWMPNAQCAQKLELSDYDLENIEDFTRENVEQWLMTHAGDFQSITDFSARCGKTIIEWENEENEFKYQDCMYPSEDE